MLGYPSTSSVIVRFCATAFLTSFFAVAAPSAPHVSTVGEVLFEHRWIAHDPLSPAGDGLGPLHNANSCVACHWQAGVGGAGPNEHNVDLVARVPSASGIRTALPKSSAKPKSNQRSSAIPGTLAESPSGILMVHRAATTSGYDPWRLRLLGGRLSAEPSFDELLKVEATLSERHKRVPGGDEYHVEGVALQRVQRQTPALFGAGLIDAIPDQVLIAAAREQTQPGSRVSGRVPVAHAELTDPLAAPELGVNPRVRRAGHFGWRGQTASLRQFVLNACANELGLEVPNQSQPAHPQAPRYVAPGIDLTAEQCEELTAYVAQLPRPRQQLPDDEGLLRDIGKGTRLFESIGCAACHLPELGGVEGLYSDLLLHDLGPTLADPIGANPASVLTFEAGVPESLRQLVNFYIGGAATSNPVLRQEWRTPPLWGVRDSAPYLHDGRAATLDDAIRLHGGEAQFTAQAFRSLRKEDQRCILLFLMTLAAPCQ